MSKLDELIKEYCPDGVEYKALSDVFDQFSGMGGVTNKWAEEGNCQFIDYMNAYTHISIDVDDLPYATVKNQKQNVLRKGDVLFTSASETPDECAISSVIEQDIRDGIFLDDHLFGLRVKESFSSNVSPSFLKYAFRAKSFRTQMNKAVRGVTRFYVSKPDFMKLVIPVPPLPVQEEIVRVLDTFTELTAELQAELQARKKQYEYYRDSLVSMQSPMLADLLMKYCPDGVESKPLWAVTIWDKKFNSVDRRKQTKAINYPYLLASDLFSLDVKNGDVFLLSTGEQTGWTTEELAGDNMRQGEIVSMPWGKSRAVTDCIKYYKGKFVTADNRIMTSYDTNVLNNKYLYYWFMSMGELVDTFYRGSGIKHPDMSKVLDLNIPIPPLPIQKEVVRILDKFSILCNDISSGLPAEIEARQKQYEYYRDKLLSFKERKA